ncbi:MAG: hypothetical protein AAF493_28950, partial [Pseudomonadota bacterium]
AAGVGPTGPQSVQPWLVGALAAIIVALLAVLRFVELHRALRERVVEYALALLPADAPSEPPASTEEATDGAVSRAPAPGGADSANGVAAAPVEGADRLVPNADAAKGHDRDTQSAGARPGVAVSQGEPEDAVGQNPSLTRRSAADIEPSRSAVGAVSGPSEGLASTSAPAAPTTAAPARTATKGSTAPVTPPSDSIAQKGRADGPRVEPAGVTREMPGGSLTSVVSVDKVPEKPLIDPNAVAKATPGSGVAAGVESRVRSGSSSSAAAPTNNAAVSNKPAVAQATPQAPAGDRVRTEPAPLTSKPPPAPAKVVVAAANPAPTELPIAKTEPVPRPASPRAPSPLIAARLDATREWLANNDGKRFSIQLMLTKERKWRSLQQFLVTRQREGQLNNLYLYRTIRNGTPWIGVLYDGFQSLSRARNALTRLPADLKKHKPFIRNIRDIYELS